MGLRSNRMNFGIVLISFIGILFFVGTVSIIMSILYENTPPAQLKLEPEPVIEKNVEAVFNNDNDFDFEMEIDEDLLE
tara:strand:+ start:516 stop:749 length:234 start_codon:yes stop_codon:yes gene_type:complete